MMIFFLFKPLDIKQQEFVDIPMFELSSFTLLELDNKGLTTLMSGSVATRYSDRYKVKNIDYTDNSKKYIANMRADSGVYKNEIVDLKDNVFYSREDGLSFKTQSVVYNKQTNLAHTDKEFITLKGDESISGTSFVYNNISKKFESTDVIVKYNMTEER